jgi:sulfur relay (sulfurtransferase) DsrF/TusC family protein
MSQHLKHNPAKISTDHDNRENNINAYPRAMCFILKLHLYSYHLSDMEWITTAWLIDMDKYKNAKGEKNLCIE